jgi:activating signal cointegrator complex subunit 3
MFRVFNMHNSKKKCVYIAPLKALVRERMIDWKVRFEEKLGKKVVELTGDVTPDMKVHQIRMRIIYFCENKF